MPNQEFDSVVRSLRLDTNQGPISKAATDLLIWHEYWLRRADFRNACLERHGAGAAWIRWSDARAYADKGPLSSTSELAVLDLAVAIGENRFCLSSMGHLHKAAIVRAFAQALGLEGIPQAGDS